MNRGLAVLSICASFVFLGASRKESPVKVIYESEKTKLVGERPLFFENGVKVMRTHNALTSDFENLYLVRTPHVKTVPLFLEELSEIEHFEAEQFAIVNITNPQYVETISHLMHREGIACGALFKMNGDAQLLPSEVTVTDPLIPVTTDVSEVRDMTALVSESSLRATIEELSAFNTRHARSNLGQTVPSWLADKYRVLAAGRDDVVVETFDHGSTLAQDSVVVRINGTTRPDEIVVLGSHIDSINHSSMSGSQARAPGSDDNASGTATNLEIFKILMAQNIRPERTVEIHGYAGEELGLVGSQDMAKKYKQAGKKVVSMVQHDMNLYKKPGAPDMIYFVTNNTVDSFNDSLGALIDRYVGVAWEKKRLSGGDSDHTSWFRQGYMTSFPFENPSSYNPKIHTKDDTVITASAFGQVAAFTKQGLAYVTHYAGLSETH